MGIKTNLKNSNIKIISAFREDMGSTGIGSICSPDAIGCKPGTIYGVQGGLDCFNISFFAGWSPDTVYGKSGTKFAVLKPSEQL